MGDFMTRRDLGTGLLLSALLVLGACGDEDPAGDAPTDAGDASDAGTNLEAGQDSDAEIEQPAARRSPGCEDGSVSAGEQDDSLTFAGASRSYRLHVPRGYKGGPTPLVVNMHGFLSNHLEQEKLTGMSALADERGFIVVYPSGAGTPPAWNAGDCCEYVDRTRDDVAFFAALVDAVADTACVDLDRVYAVGYSNGGFLSHRIACELSERVAAIATVAGVLGIAPEACEPARSVPVLQIHGDADPTVPYAGGSPMGWEILYPDVPAPSYRSAAETASFWREHDGCASTRTQVFKEGDATCERYDDCQDDSEVTLCTISGGGHTWPGGDTSAFEGTVLGMPIVNFVGTTSTSLNASSYIWEFLRQHALP